MCGIFAYKGKQLSDLPRVLLNGLNRLDYRGHDSSGIAFVNNHKISVYKEVGAISNIDKYLSNKIVKSGSGIAHTRWATHGKVTKINAHPHLSNSKDFALVHNGIVENLNVLKKELQKKDYKFKTQTDTEVIVALIEKEIKKKNDFKQAIIKVSEKIKGRNTFVLIDKEGNIYGYKNGSPLVLGIDKENGSYYLSSDTLSFSDLTNNVLTLENNEMISLINSSYQLFDAKTGRKIYKNPKIVDVRSGKIDREGYKHFMLKEIYDSSYAVEQVTLIEKKKLEILSKMIKESKKVYVLGSGTAGVAAKQIAYYLRKIAKIEATNLIGAEVVSYLELLTRNDLIITVSQSGETADVLEVLEKARKIGTKLVSYVNMPASSIEKISDINFPCNAGPEICVLSTKVFVSQIAWGFLIASTMNGNYEAGVKELKKLILSINKFLKNRKNIKVLIKWANIFIEKRDIFVLGKSQNLALAEEAMIKIIEGSYKHAHAIPAGDLKHYAITIIEKGVLVILITPDDSGYKDIISAANQVKARGATIFGVGQKGNEIFDSFLKTDSDSEAGEILNILPFQLLSYYMAISLGNNVDKPRNIAKSVTVK